MPTDSLDIQQNLVLFSSSKLLEQNKPDKSMYIRDYIIFRFKK